MSATPVRVWTKDPNAVLDYTIRFKKWLAGDRISSATWTIPTGIVNAGQYNSSETATIWLSGGTAGTSYSVSVRIVTVGGRTDDRTIQFNVEDR